jgi:hypothetical protein
MKFEKKEFDIENYSQEEIESLYGLSSVSILKGQSNVLRSMWDGRYS